MDVFATYWQCVTRILGWDDAGISGGREEGSCHTILATATTSCFIFSTHAVFWTLWRDGHFAFWCWWVTYSCLFVACWYHIARIVCVTLIINTVNLRCAVLVYGDFGDTQHIGCFDPACDVLAVAKGLLHCILWAVDCRIILVILWNVSQLKMPLSIVPVAVWRVRDYQLRGGTLSEALDDNFSAHFVRC